MLSNSERRTLERAQAICEKMRDLAVTMGEDEDDPDSVAFRALRAAADIGDIIEEA